ncbi:MAG: hypothetical protein E6Q76_05705 [Rhizobium sp.]|nr:MAG: hypothetical protein E6Q76_05705 [Rhizobium sp.]
MIAPQPWYSALSALQSRGQNTEKATSLGGLAAAREQHQGQFWTPTHIAALMWSVVAPAMERALARAPGSRVSIIDTSIGSGRLVQFATPGRHIVSGIDIDGETVAKIGQVLHEAGFEAHVSEGSLCDFKLRRHAVALLNPPFSLHFESPNVQPYPITAYGKFGPNTSAISHLYAVAQALDSCDLVVALLPTTGADEAVARLNDSGRLVARFDLPANTFKSEGANVSTAILVFGSMANGAAVIRRVVAADETVEDLGLNCHNSFEVGFRAPSHRCVSDEGPTIRTPVTGDPRVRLYRNGRRLGFRFQDGMMEAAVMNHVLVGAIQRPSELGRLPRGMTYKGQSRLDVEAHLLQDNPVESLQNLIREVEGLGAQLEIDPGLLPYIRKRIRRLQVQRTPLQHTVLVPAGELAPGAEPQECFRAKCIKPHAADPNRWGSPRLKAGDEVEIRKDPSADRYGYCVKGIAVSCTRAELSERFAVDGSSASATDTDRWVQIHAGRLARFPHIRARIEREIERQGLRPWLSWDFQCMDVLEMLCTPGGVVNASMMGLGKTREALCLALLGGGRHNLIVVEAGLIDEMTAQYAEMGVPPDTYQVIDSPAALRSLRRVNLISYSRLRMPVDRAKPKATYAKALRRRMHTVIADEAQALANDASDQSRALYALAARQRYGFSGTPVPGYPRSLLPLVCWVAGDGTGNQPYGKFQPYMEPSLIESSEYAVRGTDKFREQFCTVTWATHQWEDTFTGGHREVPVLSNLDEYRSFVSKFVLRRVWGEPEVAKHVSIPKPLERTHEIEMCQRHLSHYLAVAEEFRQYWVNLRKHCGDAGKRLNMISLLAEIQAVFVAANHPQIQADGPVRGFIGRTAKQVFAVDRIKEHVQAGRPTICFASSPPLLEMLSRDLAEAGVENIVYAGTKQRQQRTTALNRFRRGEVPAALLSYGCGSAGLNIPQAGALILMHPTWSHRIEDQAMFRVLRPQQKQQVHIDRLHLRGSLDEYQALLTNMKRSASAAGLDWLAPEHTADDFQSWISILDQFCEDLSKMRGVSRHQFRASLAA